MTKGEIIAIIDRTIDPTVLTAREAFELLESLQDDISTRIDALIEVLHKAHRDDMRAKGQDWG